MGRIVGGAGGAVGAGIGGFFLEFWNFTGNIMYLGFAVATVVAVAFAAWGAMVKYAKFELENTL
jgi:hypothetical protein